MTTAVVSCQCSTLDTQWHIYMYALSPPFLHIYFPSAVIGSRHSPIRQILPLTLRLDFMDTQKFYSSLPSPNTSPSKLLGKALENLGEEILHVANCEQGGALHKVGRSLLAKLGLPTFKSKVCTSFMPLMSPELSSTIPTGCRFEGSDNCRPRRLTH